LPLKIDLHLHSMTWPELSFVVPTAAQATNHLSLLSPLLWC